MSENNKYRVQSLKACIDYEQRKIKSELNNNIKCNIESRLAAIDKMQDELEQLTNYES